jgi:hypothetical protein
MSHRKKKIGMRAENDLAVDPGETGGNMTRHVEVRNRYHGDLAAAVGVQSRGGGLHAVGGIVVARKGSEKLYIREMLARRVDMASDAGWCEDTSHLCSTVACNNN